MDEDISTNGQYANTLNANFQFEFLNKSKSCYFYSRFTYLSVYCTYPFCIYNGTVMKRSGYCIISIAIQTAYRPEYHRMH